jgi:hypothetical protein
LKNPVIGGCIVAEGTGLGKTRQTAAALALTIEEFPAGEKGTHLPTFMITPGGPVLEQWVKELNIYPNLKVIVSNDFKPSNAAQAYKWVSRMKMRYPETEWPDHLSYDLDTDNPVASKTVIVTPFDTHSVWTLHIEHFIEILYRIIGRYNITSDILRWASFYCRSIALSS